MKHEGIQGLPTIPRNISPCNACILGKHCRQPFYGSTSRASRKLGLIHSDLCGPMHVHYANVNKYLLTFIDDYTRMCWMDYLLRRFIMNGIIIFCILKGGFIFYISFWIFLCLKVVSLSSH